MNVSFSLRLCTWAVTILLLSACGRPAHTVVVGSKNFTEQLVLGEILAQQIERRLHVPVERKFDLGGTLLAHEALLKGDIDLYPEYTGTALTAVLKQQPAGLSPPEVLERVRTAYRLRWNVEWMAPLGFNDTFAMVVTGETARQRHIASLSEAASAGAWRLGMGYEFQSRPDGLEGLLKTYSLRLNGAPAAMDLGLIYTALQRGTIDMAAGNATDGMLSVLDLRVLADDRYYFPPYECAPVVRESTLARVPGLREALNELAGRFTDEKMRKLNYEVDGRHRRLADVAAEALR